METGNSGEIASTTRGIRVTPPRRGHCDANIKRLERGTFRIPAAGADRVEMTTAELAALLAGIDLDTARRRVRYARPATPVRNSENNLPIGG
jgi:transposase